MSLDVRKFLKEKGYKFTKQRELVLNILSNNPDKHMTVEEIYEYIKPTYPEIGLATVYRTIQLFLNLNVIDSITFNDDIQRYELSENSQQHHHHHLICERCNRVIEMKEDLLEDLEAKCNNTYEFTVTNHIVKLYGICKECSSNE